MEHDPSPSPQEHPPQAEKPVESVQEKPEEKNEVLEEKPAEDGHALKNETVQIEPKKEEEKEEETIRKLVFSLQPHITEDEITQYINFEKLQNRPILKENFEEWYRTHHKKQEVKAQDSKKEIPVEPKQQPPKSQTPEEVCEQFFSNYKPGQSNEIKTKIITVLNTLIDSSLPIHSSHVANYFKSEASHSFAHFKQWISAEQERQISSNVKHFQQTKACASLQNTLKKVSQILSHTSSQKSALQINLGVGQNKGKSSVRAGLSLAHSKEENLEIQLEIKIKKKLQLKALIEAEIRKYQKQQGFNIFKLCRTQVTETEKGIKIGIRSLAFEREVCKDIIAQINKLYEHEQKPVLKVEGQFTIKNSIRSDETSLQKKRFIKWLLEGFTGHLSVEGSSALIQHFASPLSDFFPIFKVVRSGEVSLKTKNIGSVDKLFQKLGINQISEETPTIHAFFAEILKEHLSSEGLPWIPELIKRSVHFASTTPNERIGVELSGHLSHLYFHLSFASEACRELGELMSSSASELFS